MFIVCMVKPPLPPFLLAFMPRTNAATRGGAPASGVPLPLVPLPCLQRQPSRGLLLAALGRLLPAPGFGGLRTGVWRLYVAAPLLKTLPVPGSPLIARL